MLARREVDPELHTLRSAARALPNPASQHDAESARYNLYLAFEKQNADEAKRWAQALRAALFTLELPIHSIATAALTKIEKAIDDHPAKRTGP